MDARIRRDRAAQFALAVLLAFTSLLAACGGGGGSLVPEPTPGTGPSITQFTSDRASYFVGERARLTAVYSGGTGRIEPGSIAISSGATVETPVLSSRTNFRLIVTDGTRSTSRDATLEVGYRERTRTVQMPFARSEHETVVLSDGSVLVIGGEDSSGVTGTVWRFDPATETFRSFAELSTGRTAHVAVALPNDKVLVYAGSRVVSGTPRAEIIDTITGATRPTLGQPVAGLRNYSAGVLLADGRVLLVGGSGTGGAQASAEIFDPQTEQFAPVASQLTLARYAHTATRLADGRVLIYGGFGSTVGGAALVPELFDPATNSFTSLPSPETTARANHAAVRVADGSVWILGGEDLDGVRPASILRFDPTTNTFTRVPDLLTARTFARATLLTDGRVLAVGGDTPETGLASASVELLSTGGQRRTGPALATPRVLHTVTLLPATGKVLVLGGLGSSRELLATAEIFE